MSVHHRNRVIRPLEVNDVEGKDDMAEGGEEEEEEEESGRRKIHKMNSPGKPSAAEVEEHCLTHLPFRNWCRHCVRGRGKEASHQAGQGEGGDFRSHFGSSIYFGSG